VGFSKRLGSETTGEWGRRLQIKKTGLMSSGNTLRPTRPTFEGGHRGPANKKSAEKLLVQDLGLERKGRRIAKLLEDSKRLLCSKRSNYPSTEVGEKKEDRPIGCFGAKKKGKTISLAISPIGSRRTEPGGALWGGKGGSIIQSVWTGQGGFRWQRVRCKKK